MSAGATILGWWARELGNRESGPARALAARLRRAGPVDALAESAVQELGRALALRDGARLSRLVRILAEVREHDGATLPRRLGGAEPAMSTLRFQRLIRADEAELTDTLRRAIILADRRCNVAALGADLLHWGEATKTNWCFHYYGGEPPRPEPTETEA
ncbi:MAG: type I-E CRISPR-associated protein Cse2/CasB [Rhodobacteraceae bacterium]|nr:type I-E CRISPR-associated protein Cse2/CasB [Paracoccaceae bacterium]